MSEATVTRQEACAEDVARSALELRRAARAVISVEGTDVVLEELLIRRAAFLAGALWRVEALTPGDEKPAGWDDTVVQRALWSVPVVLRAAAFGGLQGPVLDGAQAEADDPAELATLPSWKWVTTAAHDIATDLLRWAQQHGVKWAEDEHLQG